VSTERFLLDIAKAVPPPKMNYHLIQTFIVNDVDEAWTFTKMVVSIMIQDYLLEWILK